MQNYVYLPPKSILSDNLLNLIIITMDKNLSWFLGPKAENASTFEDLLHVIVNDCFHWRKNYFPDDPLLITKSDQRDFDADHDKLYQNVHEFLAALRRNFPFYNPRYIAHMLSDVTMPSLLGYIGGLLYNPNNVTTEAAPVTTEWEIEACNQILEMIGYKLPPLPPKSDSDSENYKNKLKEEFGWAHICSGGSLANIEALWVARCVKYLPLSIRDTVQKLPNFTQILEEAEKEEEMQADAKNQKKETEKGLKIKTPSGEVVDILDVDKIDNFHLINIKPSESIYLLSKYIQAYVKYVDRKHSSEKGYVKDWKKTSKEAMKLLSQSEYSLSNNMGKLLSEYPLAIFVSGTAHYSIHKAADLLGIGRNNIRFIEIEPDFRMSMSSLKKEIHKCYSSGISPLAVIGIVGTTEEGAIDPIHKILDIRKDFEDNNLSFWIHVDSAWGGYCKSILQLEDEQIVRIKVNKVLGLLDLISKNHIDYYKDVREGTENIKNSINDIIKRKNEEVLNEKILKEIATIIPELFDKDGNFSENKYDEYCKEIKGDDKNVKDKVNLVLGLLEKNKRLKNIGDTPLDVREGMEIIWVSLNDMIKKIKEEKEIVKNLNKRGFLNKEEILNEIKTIIPEIFDKDSNLIESMLDDYSRKIKEDDQIIRNKINQVLELLVDNKCFKRNGIAYVDVHDGIISIKHSINDIIQRKKEKALNEIEAVISDIVITDDNFDQYYQTVKKDLYLYNNLDTSGTYNEFKDNKDNQKIIESLPYVKKIVEKPRKYENPNIKKLIDKQIFEYEIKKKVLGKYNYLRKIEAKLGEYLPELEKYSEKEDFEKDDFEKYIKLITTLYVTIYNYLFSKISEEEEIIYKEELKINKDDRVKELQFITSLYYDVRYKEDISEKFKLSGNDDNFVSAYLGFKYADSVTIDPHKMGYLPYPCGVIAFKNDRIRHLIAQEAPYITSSNNNNALVHKPPLHDIDDDQWENSNVKRGSCIDAFAPYILEGSKPGAAAASLWLTNKCIPLTSNGYGRIVRDSLLASRALYSSIKLWNVVLDSFKVKSSYILLPVSWRKPDLNVVVFVVKSKLKDPTLNNLNDLTNKIYQKYSLQVELGNREYSYGQAFFLSKTTFSYPFYNYSALSDFFTRSGIQCTRQEYETQGLIVLRATLMNPYLWAYKENRKLDFINDFMINMHNELEELNKEEKLKRETNCNQYLNKAANEKNPFDALQLFDQAIKVMPDSEVAYQKRGDLKNAMGDIDGALADYAKAISITPDNGELYFKRAKIFLAMGEYEKALPEAKKAIKRDNKYQHYYTRGVIYMAMNNWKAALKDFNQTLSKNNDYLDALENRIECCRKLAEEEKDEEKKKALLAQAEADEKRLEALKNKK